MAEKMAEKHETFNLADVRGDSSTIIVSVGDPTSTGEGVRAKQVVRDQRTGIETTILASAR